MSNHYQMMSDDELIEAAKYQTMDTDSKYLAEELAKRLQDLKKNKYNRKQMRK